MWGEKPTTSALITCEEFAGLGLKRILIPGFGYGRNAKPFIDKGFDVTGIEISRTAIELARRELGGGIPIFHGSVADMPFSQDLYDGIFCHALIHLLRSEERATFLKNCFLQTKPGGRMVFTTITKAAPTYGVGEKLGKDLYRTKDNVELFFFDEESIAQEFSPFGLKEWVIIEEPSAGPSTTAFWKITCQKDADGGVAR